jgi:hypothetical protein
MGVLANLTERARKAINRIPIFSEKEKRLVHVALDSSVESAIEKSIEQFLALYNYTLDDLRTETYYQLQYQQNIANQWVLAGGNNIGVDHTPDDGQNILFTDETAAAPHVLRLGAVNSALIKYNDSDVGITTQWKYDFVVANGTTTDITWIPKAGETIRVNGVSNGVSNSYAIPSGGLMVIKANGAQLDWECCLVQGGAGGGGGDFYADGSVPLDSYIDFTPSAAPAWAEGRMYYDSTDGAMSYYNSEADVTVNLAEEDLVRVRNVSGVTINDGEVVYISGSTGEVPQVTKAIADTSHVKMLGVATHSIENNSFGYVTTFGIVRGIDLSTYATGDLLYLSDSVAGGLTTTKPTHPTESVEIGTVIKNTASGKLFVSIDHVYMHELSDDSSPSLGGDLDVAGSSIISTGNGNIPIAPDGTGSVILDGLNWPQADGTTGQVLGTNGSGQLSFSTIAAGSSPSTGYGSISADSNATSTTFSGSSIDWSNKVQITVFDTNGASSSGVTPDHTNDHITTVNAGAYFLHASITFSGGSSNTYSFAFFKNNGATQLGNRTTRKLGTGGDVGACDISAAVELNANDTIELWVQNEGATTAAVIEDINFEVVGLTGLGSVVEDTSPQLGGQLDVNGYSIYSQTGVDLELNPGVSAYLVLDGMYFPQTPGTNGQVLTTNGSAALSWTTISSGADFLSLTDTPSSYSGQAGKWLKVNAGASALEFTAAPVSSVSATPKH